jgi:hypothetical protein
MNPRVDASLGTNGGADLRSASSSLLRKPVCFSPAPGTESPQLAGRRPAPLESEFINRLYVGHFISTIAYYWVALTCRFFCMSALVSADIANYAMSAPPRISHFTNRSTQQVQNDRSVQNP